jgi:hypothetical protein
MGRWGFVRRKERAVGDVTIEDRVLIRELYDTFYFGLNDGDPDVIRGCFAQGGGVTLYDGSLGGPEFGAATAVLWAKDPVGTTYQHHVTNMLVSPDPEGREDVRSVRMYFMVTGVWDPPHVIIRWSCEAHDEVRRVDGRWLFSRRKISLNHDSTGPHWDNEPPHPDRAQIPGLAG